MPARLIAIATVLAAMFWFYPTDYSAARPARQLRPVVLPVHADRTEDADAGPVARVLADRQLAATGRDTGSARPRADEG